MIFWVDILSDKELFKTEFMKTENFIIHLIGTWFASYPDRQFINDFRLSKQGFQVIQINEMK